MSERANAPRAVFTDGACSGNPGRGGWAWALDEKNFASGFAQHTTNQRMEIQAAFEAVKALDGPLEVVSDSTYVVNCFKKRWWEGWLARGWVNSQKKPVANRDLWEPFIELVRRRGNVSFRWVKGHSGHRMNDLVDRLAVEAIENRGGRSRGAGAAKPAASKGSEAPSTDAPRGPAPKGRAARGTTRATEGRQRTLSGVDDAGPAGGKSSPVKRTPAKRATTRRPVVHVVCGGTGAGKTTYAIELSAERGALRFSIDEWMKTLFLPDAEEIVFEWMKERIGRCEAQIRSVGEQALRLGQDVVLDLGFTTREHRARFREWAEGIGAASEVHFVDVPSAERRERVQQRNQEKDGPVYAMEVTDEMFDFMEGMFEPPTEAELAGGQRIAPRARSRR